MKVLGKTKAVQPNLTMMVGIKLMANAMKMDKVINVHTAIMDRYDPEKKIDLIVDEWGNWFDVEIGTNPGFLYQQNTMRDVISGMLILHVFHKHNDRVKMANIAQMVNVLQAMILTDGEKMVLTPTYHLFRMMKGHMDGERVDVDYDCEEQEINGLKFPKISISASKKKTVKLLFQSATQVLTLTKIWSLICVTVNFLLQAEKFLYPSI